MQDHEHIITLSELSPGIMSLVEIERQHDLYKKYHNTPILSISHADEFKRYILNITSNVPGTESNINASGVFKVVELLHPTKAFRDIFEYEMSQIDTYEYSEGISPHEVCNISYML
jgi:hypothetical protein